MTTPRPRQYYSHRHGLHQDSLRLTLDQLKELFLADFKQFNTREYFQESFGYMCVDTGENLGAVGDAAAFFLRRLHRPGLWPVPEAVALYSEHDLFDVIELLARHFSERPRQLVASTCVLDCRCPCGSGGLVWVETPEFMRFDADDRNAIRALRCATDKRA